MRQFVVIGLGQFGISVATTLAQSGQEVMVIDTDEEKVQAISDVVTHAVRVEATDEKALRALGVADVDVAVVCIGDIEDSILTTMILRDMGVPEIIAKASNILHGKVLQKVGASKVIFPERDMGVRVAKSLIAPNVIELVGGLSSDYNIVEAVAPPAFVGRTLKELAIRNKYNVTVIGIRRKVPQQNPDGSIDYKEDTNMVVQADDVILPGDTLLILGARESIDLIRQEFGKESLRREEEEESLWDRIRQSFSGQDERG
ncbi:MAG: potassium channel family protein [bacterium]